MSEFTLSIGGQQVDRFSRDLLAAGATAADLEYALQRQKTRILSRTARGVDAEGRAFAPYSTKGPYYHYPGKGSKGRRAAAGRFAKKTGGTRTRVGVRFESYADFKRSLGRSVVDLLGPRAPHMLQAVVVRTRATSSGDVDGTIGVYGPEAARAEGHNLGTRTLPKREWFSVGRGEDEAIMRDVEALVYARVKKMF